MKKIILITVFVVAFILFAVIWIRFGGSKVKYNNQKKVTELVTKKYEEADFYDLRSKAENMEISFEHFSSQFEVQCLRKTYQGYYAVFLLMSGEQAFVFMNNNMEINRVLVTDHFLKKDAFSFIEKGKTTQFQITNVDHNTSIGLPVSSFTIIAHIVQEGVLVIRYNRLDAETFQVLEDPVVESVTFYKNSDFPLKDDPVTSSSVPFILEIDKID